MKTSIDCFRINGITIQIHASWLIALILVAWFLGEGILQQHFPNWSFELRIGLGVMGTLVIFLSVLLHELAHSFTARRLGLPAESITLFVFGGISNLGDAPSRARDEFAIAISGPATSLLLAGIFSGVLEMFPALFRTPAGMILSYCATINFFLGTFNLIPGLPLDGGRIFRSVIWRWTGDQVRATNIASGAGQVTGWLILLLGLYQIVIGSVLTAIWLVTIGWFLKTSARNSGFKTTLGKPSNFPNASEYPLTNTQKL